MLHRGPAHACQSVILAAAGAPVDELSAYDRPTEEPPPSIRPKFSQMRLFESSDDRRAWRRVHAWNGLFKARADLYKSPQLARTTKRTIVLSAGHHERWPVLSAEMRSRSQGKRRSRTPLGRALRSMFLTRARDSEGDDLSSQEGERIASNTVKGRENITATFVGGLNGPDLLSILVVYFVQGALGLARLAVTYRLKDEIGLSPADVASVTALSATPWALKPLYGYLSDSVPIGGLRRRPYLWLGSGLCSGGWMWLALGVGGPATWSVAAGATAAAAGLAMSDVVADSIVVEKTRESAATDNQGAAGDLQSTCFLAYSVGGLVSAYFSGSLLEIVGTTEVFAITALLPILVAISAFFIQEDCIEVAAATTTRSVTLQDDQGMNAWAASTVFRGVEWHVTTFTAQMVKVWVTLRLIWVPVAFMFVWLSSPTVDSAFFFFLTNELGFKPELLGVLNLASAVASLVGVLVYRTYLKDRPIAQVFLGTAIASVPVKLLQIALVTRTNVAWGVPDAWLMLGDDILVSALGRIAFLPQLVLAARLCPPGVEGTVFGALMSIYNGSGIVGQQLGAWLTEALGVTETDFSHLPLLIAICMVWKLVPLPFLGVLSSIDETTPTTDIDPSPTLLGHTQNSFITIDVDGDTDVGEIDEYKEVGT